jgi:Glycosyltransferase family 87
MFRIGRGPLLLFVGAAILLADVVIIWIGLQADFGFDFSCCYQQAGQRVLDDPGTLYAWSDTYTFRYTPIGALVFAPLALLSADAAAVVWLVFKLAILGVAAAWYSAPWRGSDRLLVVLLVLAFPPIVHDLVIGNVSTITLLVLLAVARWRDLGGGVALGALMILAPKPHLLPVLAWMIIRRPRAFLAALATMAAGFGVGVVLLGLQPWLDFVGSLREPLERTFTANIGFSGLFGVPGVVLGVVAALVVWVGSILRRGESGLGLAIVSGILAGPYTFIHYLSGTLVAVEPVLRSRPRLLVPYPWLLIIFPLIPVWLLLLAWTLWRHGGEAGPPEAAPG